MRMPVTSADKKMAQKHNKDTIKLEKSKIKDHLKMMKKAKKSGNFRSAAYHEAHAKEHMKDTKLREKYAKKVAKIRSKNG